MSVRAAAIVMLAFVVIVTATAPLWPTALWDDPVFAVSMVL